jgi:hypothetical protein
MVVVYFHLLPKRTIYVRDADAYTWSRAEELAGGNISSAISQALADYVAKGEREMNTTSGTHGSVKKRWLYVWHSADSTGDTAEGKQFDTLGTGPHQAQWLITLLKRRAGVRHIRLEERRLYQDGALQDEILSAWSRPGAHWMRVPG